MTALFAAAGVLLLLVLALPLANLFLTTDLHVFGSMCLEPRVREALWLSVNAGLSATVLALILGVPLAYLLARREFRGKAVIEGLLDLPIAIPHTAAGVALLTVFGQRAWGGRLLGAAGLRFVGTDAGIVLAMFFVSVPFLMRSARDGFAAVDPRMEDSARSLGAEPWQVFWKIALPLASRGIFTGALLMWARAISEFGAVMILAYHPMTAPVLIWDEFEISGLDHAQAVSVLLLLICLALFGVLRHLTASAERR